VGHHAAASQSWSPFVQTDKGGILDGYDSIFIPRVVSNIDDAKLEIVRNFFKLSTAQTSSALVDASLRQLMCMRRVYHDRLSCTRNTTRRYFHTSIITFCMTVSRSCLATLSYSQSHSLRHPFLRRPHRAGCVRSQKTWYFRKQVCYYI
jgi:hypothetical protein